MVPGSIEIPGTDFGPASFFEDGIQPRRKLYPGSVSGQPSTWNSSAWGLVHLELQVFPLGPTLSSNHGGETWDHLELRHPTWRLLRWYFDIQTWRLLDPPLGLRLRTLLKPWWLLLLFQATGPRQDKLRPGRGCFSPTSTIPDLAYSLYCLQLCVVVLNTKTCFPTLLLPCYR